MTLSIPYDTADGTALAAYERGGRESVCVGSLAPALALYPLMMVKLIAAIHWHALRLWLKVARLQPRPAARV
jgi:DUF1365 family protein